MNKRRLSRQQKTRIRRHQQNLLHEQSDEHQSGLVVARYTRHADIKSDINGHISRCNIRANIESIAVGDRVLWQAEDNDAGVVLAVEPRRNLIERPDGMGKLKPVAANIDQIFVVLAREPEPHSILLDRYLLASENAGIDASIVMNKIDSPAQAAPFEDLLSVYRELDYPVYITSCKHPGGLEDLRQALYGKTSVFVGQSGVGKSSIISTLLPEESIRIGELSDLVQKGRHTTTTATLFELPDGGCLIDSPGIREFHLDHFNAEQIYAGFRELQALIGQCRFRDCHHDNEPDCAIKAFIADGKMHASRVQSLQYILSQKA